MQQRVKNIAYLSEVVRFGDFRCYKGFRGDYAAKGC